MVKSYDFNIGDEVRFFRDSVGGQIKKGSIGVITEDYGDALFVKLTKVIGSWKPKTIYVPFSGSDIDDLEVISKGFSNDKNNIIEDIHGEHIAINQYLDHINATADKQIIEKLVEIKAEEEHHLDELNKLYEKKGW